MRFGFVVLGPVRLVYVLLGYVTLATISLCVALSYIHLGWICLFSFGFFQVVLVCIILIMLLCFASTTDYFAVLGLVPSFCQA